MKHKFSRNNPCSCGSGKKYKKCCLPTETNSAFPFPEVSDKEWFALRHLEGVVFDQHLIPYATRELSSDMIKSAMVDCFPGNLPEPIDESLFFDSSFIPWFSFNWRPYDDFGVTPFVPEISLAQNY